MQCPMCGTVNPTQARFCMSCGILLLSGAVCGNCNTLLPLQARYCFHCGAFQAKSTTVTEQPGVSLAPTKPVATPKEVITQPTPAEIPGVTRPATPAKPQVAAPTVAAPAQKHQVGQIPMPRPLEELLPSLVHYLPQDLYEPLEGVPNERNLLAARDHLTALLGTLKTYLPWPVVSSPQPPGEPAGGMYRGVFLFVDVSGFTPLSEKLKALGQEGAEIITNLINALFTDLVTALFDHGGTLLKFGGDALLGLFPAETDEDMTTSALRAAQTALAMQEALKKEQFSDINVLGETLALKIKCGISAGPYFAAHIGTRPSEINPKGTMAYITTGNTVNLAEKAEGHANPEEIAMTREVSHLLGEYVKIVPVNKEPDENFVRLIAATPLEGGAAARLEINEPPAGDVTAQITYLAERLDRITPYLSTELVSRIVTNPRDARIRPENRPVTVMFANYKGVSKLIEKLGDKNPDLITQHLNNYFVHMASIVEHYEGTLARMDQYSVGDRLVIFFGAPHAHEDDPVRAVTTALEMQQAVDAHFKALRTPTGVNRFEQRIGINTGFLFAGNAGAPDLRQEYTLMGDDINMAARLMSTATWSDIFISKKTAEHVEAFFDLEDKGELKVKGKEIRIPTFMVLGKRGQVGRIRGLEEGESPLIGRDQQLETLKERGQEFLASRRGQIVVLMGNSGLGKSRLLRELKTWLLTYEEAEGIRWIEARALSFSEQMSYWMAAEVMRGLLDVDSKADEDEVLYSLGEHCEQLLGDESMDALPYLTYMMGLDLGEEWAWVKELDPKVRQKQTFRSASGFFTAAAREHPTIIALDDLHWADEASLGLIEHLLRVTDKAALMFCLVFRARRDKRCWQLRDRAAADFPHRYVEVALTPLDQELSATLLEKLLPGAQFKPETHQDILDKAAGNPFYLEEVVRSLRENGAVVRDPEEPEQWLVTNRIDQIKVPDTLQAAIVARIDRLTEDTRQALQTAAVIGRQFRLKLFRKLAQTEEEIDFWLSQLERGGLIKPAEVSDDPLYDFPDALVQEVAYESLLVQSRQQLHNQIGKTLESYYANEAEETQQDLEQILWNNCELLAYHFSRSDDQEQAIKYLEMAAKRARDQYANQTAIEHFSEITKIKRNLGDKDGQASALYSIGVIAYEIGDYDQARKALEESIDLYQEIEDTKNEGWSVMYVGMVDLKQANYVESARHHQRALDLARSQEETFQEGIHLTNLARVIMRLGQYDLALETFQQSLEMKQQVKDLTGQGFALFYQGLIYIYQGRYEEAQTALHGTIEMWEQVEKNERLISYYHYGMGLLALGLGQFQGALSHLEEAYRLCEKLELRAEIIENLSALSQAQLGLGDLQAATKLSSQAVALLVAQKDVEEVQGIYLNHYRVLLASGDPGAGKFLQEAHQTMISQANRIDDDGKRQIYLEQVKVNQEINAAMLNQAGTDDQISVIPLGEEVKDQPDWDRVKEYALRLLEEKLPPNLTYHGIHHTRDDVLPAVTKLAALAGLNKEDTLLLRTAALFHDIGFIEQYHDNETIGARIASETLPQFGFRPDQIEMIIGIILATQMPQSPRNLLQQFMCDADLDSLGREDFLTTSQNFRQEQQAHGIDMPLKEWYEEQLTFLSEHSFFTAVAQSEREAGKQNNIQKLRKLLVLEELEEGQSERKNLTG